MFMKNSCQLKHFLFVRLLKKAQCNYRVKLNIIAKGKADAVVFRTSLNERVSAFVRAFKELFWHGERLMIGTVNTEENFLFQLKHRR